MFHLRGKETQFPMQFSTPSPLRPLKAAQRFCATEIRVYTGDHIEKTGELNLITAAIFCANLWGTV